MALPNATFECAVSIDDTLVVHSADISRWVWVAVTEEGSTAGVLLTPEDAIKLGRTLIDHAEDVMRRGA